MTGPLEWGGRILGFARISRTGYAIFFLFGGGTRKNIFRVPGTRKKKVAYPPSWGGRFLIFFKNWACEIPRTRYVCSGM